MYKVCVQPLDGSEFTVHVDVAACRISDLKSQICAKNGMCPSEQLLYLISSSSGTVSPAFAGCIESTFALHFFGSPDVSDNIRRI